MPLPPVGLPPPQGEPGLPEDWFWEREEPTEADLLGLRPDLLAGPPDGEDAWLGDLSLAELDALAGQHAAGEGRQPDRDGVGAGFGRDLPGDPAVGFAAGGPLDSLAPGQVLASFAGETFDAGFTKLSDDQLVGVLCAARRLESRQAAMEFTAIAELDARRRAQAEHPESSRVHDHMNAELAAALTMTGKSADALLDLARSLTRLPVVLAALAAGKIDRDRAAIFAAELAVLDARKAAAVAMGFTDLAGSMTAGQLRAALRAMVLALNPDAAKERAEKGRRQARVEIWPESSGNSGIAGRELPVAEAMEADARITAIAQTLRDAGAPGDLGQLRVAVFTALLTGRDPNTLLPDPAAGASADTITGTAHLTMPAQTWPPSPGWQEWLASVQVQWLERDRCGHPRKVKSYRAGRTLRHLVVIRHRTCAFPGCSRPAARCDLDHTIPWDQSGITCECNLAALCRQHHQTKQAQGWHLTQPQPGVLTWTAPHGRSYTVTPDKYPDLIT